MLFGSILTVAVLAVTGISANPVAVPNIVEERDFNPYCPGGSYWWNGKCVCPYDKNYWDWEKNVCRKPYIPKPYCKQDEKPYCVKSKNEYCGWDQYRNECEDDHHNIAFCCKENDLYDRIKQYYPDHDEDHHCYDSEGYKWNPHHQKCECPDHQYWNDYEKKCKWSPLPKPYCPDRQKPRCGETKDRWHDYDDKNDYCRNDGYHKTFCCEDKDIKYWLDRLFSN